jgi:hypothetical protein
MSPRPLFEPNLRPGPSSSLGLNLPPMVQVSSLSAAPPPSEPTKAEFLRLGASDSGARGGREGRLERQSREVSETPDGRSDGGPSLRRRDESRESRSGSGPCRRHSPENFGSSDPPKPARSLAECSCKTGGLIIEENGHTRLGNAHSHSSSCQTLHVSLSILRRQMGIRYLTDPVFARALLRSSSSSNST